MTTTTTTGLTLCRLSRDQAEHLMLAPAAAGGWIAVHPDCCEAVSDALVHGVDYTSDSPAEYLALLPASWTEASQRPVTADQARRIAAQLDRRAAHSVVEEPSVPADFAARIRAQMAPDAEVRS